MYGGGGNSGYGSYSTRSYSEAFRPGGAASLNRGPGTASSLLYGRDTPSVPQAPRPYGNVAPPYGQSASGLGQSSTTAYGQQQQTANRFSGSAASAYGAASSQLGSFTRNVEPQPYSSLSSSASAVDRYLGAVRAEDDRLRLERDNRLPPAAPYGARSVEPAPQSYPLSASSSNVDRYLAATRVEDHRDAERLAAERDRYKAETDRLKAALERYNNAPPAPKRPPKQQQQQARFGNKDKFMWRNQGGGDRKKQNFQSGPTKPEKRAPANSEQIYKELISPMKKPKGDNKEFIEFKKEGLFVKGDGKDEHLLCVFCGTRLKLLKVDAEKHTLSENHKHCRKEGFPNLGQLDKIFLINCPRMGDASVALARRDILQNVLAREKLELVNQGIRLKDGMGSEAFWCEPCKLHLPSLNVVNEHIKARRHTTNAADYSVGVKLDELVQDTPEANVKVRGLEEQLKLNNKPIVGLNHIIEYIDPREILQRVYECKLCDSRDGESSILSHLSSYEHRVNYIKTKDETEAEKYKEKTDELEKQLETRILELEVKDGPGEWEKKVETLDLGAGGDARPSDHDENQAPSHPDEDMIDLEQEQLQENNMLLEAVENLTLSNGLQANYACKIVSKLAEKYISYKLQMLPETERETLITNLRKELTVPEIFMEKFNEKCDEIIKAEKERIAKEEAERQAKEEEERKAKEAKEAEERRAKEAEEARLKAEEEAAIKKKKLDDLAKKLEEARKEAEEAEKKAQCTAAEQQEEAAAKSVDPTVTNGTTESPDANAQVTPAAAEGEDKPSVKES